MSEKRLVKDLIIDVLENNNNGYMTVADIAEVAFGEAYNVYTNKYLEERTRRSVDRALGELAGKGYITISLKNEKLKGNPIDRWKIATEEDQPDVARTLKRKANRANGFVNATQQLRDNAIEKGLLTDDEIKKIGNSDTDEEVEEQLLDIIDKKSE